MRAADEEFVLADIPGLLKGAHQGAGLGQKFLRHIERCHVLIHLIDASRDDLARVWTTIRDELAAYGAGLSQKKEITILSKSDLLHKDDLKAKISELHATTKKDVLALSSFSHHGLDEAKQFIHAFIKKDQAETQEAAQKEKGNSWQP